MVDISPSAVSKITDQQSFQSIGLVTDVEPFLRELVEDIATQEKAGRDTSSKSARPAK
jgi:hypothetical protein